MKIILNSKSPIKEVDCYPCYSFPLKDFLEEDKGIMPIKSRFNKHTQKACFLFLKTDELDTALKEWTYRKQIGDFYKPKDGDSKNGK